MFNYSSFFKKGPLASRHRMCGVSTTEYVIALSFALAFLPPLYMRYGTEIRTHMALAADQFSEYYYQGWFWPHDDFASPGAAPPPRAGHGSDNEGGPADGGPSAPGNGGADTPPGGGSSTPDEGAEGTDGGNASSGGSGAGNGDNSGGAGGEPQMCGGNPRDAFSSPSIGGMSPVPGVGNAPSFTAAGNPIDLGTGNKYQYEIDYVGSGRDPLVFTRGYNSLLGDRDTGLGYGWRHSYQRSLRIDRARHRITVWRDDGTQYPFTLHPGSAGQPDRASAPLGVVDRLERGGDTWFYRTASGDMEIYDLNGRLLQIDTANGHRQRLTYRRNGRLHTVTDDRGSSLVLHWDGRHLATVALPNGDVLRYGYDSANNLHSQRRSRGLLQRALDALVSGHPERRYRYEDTRHIHALTGLDDATGARYATWGYDNLGRAILSQHGDGAEKVTLEYRDPEPGNPLRHVRVTNAAGLTATYTLEPARPGKYRLRDIDGARSFDCPAIQNHHRYDERGFLASQYNADRIGSTYARNARGLIEQEIHGLRFDARENPRPVSGTTRIDRTWHQTHPWVIAETRSSWQTDAIHPGGYWQPVLERTLAYDDRSRVLSETVTDRIELSAPYQTAGAQRRRSYAYTWRDLAQTDLARLAVSDGNGHVTTYHFQDDRLSQIDDALGRRTLFGDYTDAGQPQRIELANDQSLQIAYNDRGLPIALTRQPAATSEATGNIEAAPETIRATYDAVGRLIRLRLADGGEQIYTYSAAGQLTRIENGWGESLELTPNALHGQWETQTQRGGEGRISQRRHRRFNAMGQLVAVLGNAGQQTSFGYDASGNLVEASEGDEDPARADTMHITAARYDTQHRLLSLIDAAGYRTDYTHSPSGAIEAISDANQSTTEYQRNGFGEIIKQTSPTTGSVVKRYDGNGNLIENQSPSGASVQFHYDALNRLRRVDCPGEANDITYTYDQTDQAHGHGLQQLTRIDTATQAIDYRYDDLGRKIEERTTDKSPVLPAREEQGVKATAEITTLQYRYLTGSRLGAITYPDGSVVTYRYDKDRIEEVTYRDVATGKQITVLHDIAYAPFGGPVAWTYGNGLTQRKRLDLDGRINAIELTEETLTGSRSLWSQRYTYDLYQNIEVIGRKDNGASQEQRFGYDAVDRLTREETVAGAEASGARSMPQIKKRYEYDGAGNRSEAENVPIIHYDSIGNIEILRTAGDERRYVYNANNRPAARYDNNELQALYGYNALGWRQEKRTYRGGERLRTRYIHTAAGKLLSERREAQATEINYLWLGAVPIAQTERSPQGESEDRKSISTIVYLHTDHLTAPRVASDADQRIIWRWRSDAFGNGAPDEAPDQDGTITRINLRFAGQYADTESGLYYNLHRYYDPETGRYTQSDPFGLLPSLNSYSYVDANPVSWLDPLGLAKLQYVLIDSFGGDPTNSGKSTLKSSTDKRMIHFAFLLTDIEGAPGASLIYDPLGIAPLTGDRGWHSWNNLEAGQSGLYGGDYVDLRPWSNFRNFYENGFSGKTAFNTGDWAVINDYSDESAAELYRSITGNYPAGYASNGNASCPAPKDFLLPVLPQGFYAMEHFNFPTIVHKLTKPIFEVEQLPAANDAVFHTFPWYNDLTKPAEASNTEALMPHWPKYPSGITLGRSFDLSKFSTNTNVIKRALQRVGIDKPLITNAVGLSTILKKDANGKDIPGSDAVSQYWKTNKTELQKIRLTAEQQYLLSLYAFEAKGTNIHNVAGASSGVIKLYDEHIKGGGPAWEDLDQKIRDVLFDLNYRGDFKSLSGNTKEKASTPFDDVAFAQSFRDAVQSNSVGDLCRVMNSKNWLEEPGNLWSVPEDRWKKRTESLFAEGSKACAQ